MMPFEVFDKRQKPNPHAKKSAPERVYLPHIWIQQTGIGPDIKIWAGEIVDRSGHPYRGVRFAALTKPGFDELTALLQADIKALSGAA